MAKGKSKKKSRAARDAALAQRVPTPKAATPPVTPRAPTPPIPVAPRAVTPPVTPPVPPAPVVCPPPPMSGPTPAPTTRQDPRFLGDGASKMVWLPIPDADMNREQLPHMKHVVVNAFDGQLFHGHGTRDQILREKIEEQENEYDFTLMVRAEFPDLIPQVYKIPGNRRITPQPRYRYYKDRCDPLPKNDALFHTMIQIVDRVIDQGWVYLDMKPGNVGLFEGRVVLLDTDPSFFYKLIPQADPAEELRVRRHYRISCHMIVILFCLNFVSQVTVETLQDFIRAQGYTLDTFREINMPSPIRTAAIEQYNYDMARLTPYDVVFNDLKNPLRMIHHYGEFDEPIPNVDAAGQPILDRRGNPTSRIVTSSAETRFHRILLYTRPS